MNPPTSKEKREPEPIIELRDSGEMPEGFTVKLSKEMRLAIKDLALKLGMHDWEVFTLLVDEGFEAIVGDALQPVARILIPSAFDWIGNHKPWREAKKKRLRELLIEANKRVKVEKK